MALVIADRVKETTATTGTGRITLSGATFGGFQTFSDTIGDGNSTYYCIQNDRRFEIGVGAYRSSDNTLSRDTVLQSSNSDNLISLEGVSTVFCVLPAEKLVFKDTDNHVNIDTPLALKRSTDGDYLQAYSTDFTNRVVSLFVEEGSDPTWTIGLKTSSSDLLKPSYAFVEANDGLVTLYANANAEISIGDQDSEGLQVDHQLQNIVDLRKNGGEISVQNLDFTSTQTTTAQNSSIGYTVFAVEASIGHTADLQTWSVGTTEKASINADGDFQTVSDIIASSGRFSAIRFSDATIQTTAALPFGSGSLIDQNAEDIATVSGLLYDDTAISGYFESRVDQADSDIATVSGLLYDDAAISGYFESRVDQADSDIATVSGLLYDNSAVSGYFESRVDQADSDIATVSGLLYNDTALSGYFESRTDLADSNIDTVSGLLTPSGESFDFAGNVLTYNNSDGGSFTADLSSLSTFDTSGVSLSYSAGIITYTNNAAGTFDVDISSISGDVYALIVGSAPETLNTLDEIAAALNDDANIATTLTDLISTTSGNLQSQITSNDGDISQLNSDIATVSGLLYDDTAVSGYFESRVDSADSDIATVSGLLYDDAAISGYFESRVDSADSSIAANSGYFESRVDSADSDIATVSGIAVYASGHNLQSITDNGASTTNAITITNNNITASSGLFDSLDMTPLGNGSQPAYQEGVVFYDSENHTLSLYNDEADVTLQLGQEEFLRVRNNTGATIPNGAAVLINGAHGNAAPTVSGAIATSEASSQVVGLTTHSIEDNSFGYVTTYGIVRDVDTSAFSAGDEIFLSATQIGSGVAVAPVIPNYKISLGHVINSASSNGSILVQVGNPKLGGGDLKSEKPLNISGVPFVTSISNTTAGGSQTDPLFIFDSGNRQLQLGSGVQLLDGAPSNTSNVLYNEGGVLKFNGSTVDTIYDDTYVSGIATYASGQAIQNEIDIAYVSGIAVYASGNSGGGGSSLTAGSGITIDGADQINVYGGSGHFISIQNDGITTLNSGVKTVINTEADAATITFDMDTANTHRSTLAGNRTLAVSNVDDGQKFSIKLSQDGTGSRTVTWWNTINWLTSDGSEPTLKTDPGAEDYFGFVCTSGGFYDGFHLTEDLSTVASTYSAGSGLTLVGGEFNVYGGSGQFIDLKLQSDGVDDLLTLISTDDGSSAAPVISTMRDSASPADGDYLGQIKFKGRSDTGTERVYAKITGKTLDVTNGTEDGLIEIAVMSNGSQEIVSRIRNDGWRIVNDNNLYIQDNGSLGVRVSPSYSLHVQDDAYIGSGLTLPDVTPASTDNKVYNEGTKLHFNGSGIPVSHPVTNASGVNNMMIINSGDYTALASKDPNTIYFLV